MTIDQGTPPTMEKIADRMAITDILHNHCRGLDRRDSNLLKSCYWPEAEVDYGSYRGPAQMFAELVVGALGDSYELTRHCIGNTVIDLRDGTAHVESYVNADHLLIGAALEMCFAGRYLDLLEKRDGQWRVLHRQVVMDWSRTREVDDQRDSEAFAALSKGGHGTDDPLHPFLASGDQV
jgi:hypothetical protein